MEDCVRAPATKVFIARGVPVAVAFTLSDGYRALPFTRRFDTAWRKWMAASGGGEADFGIQAMASPDDPILIGTRYGYAQSVAPLSFTVLDRRQHVRLIGARAPARPS
jgi:hypothetical protein